VYGPEIHRIGLKGAPQLGHLVLLELVRAYLIVLRDPEKADSILKVALRIQGCARAGGTIAGVSTADGTGGGRAGADRALLASIHDLPRRVLDRADPHDSPVRVQLLAVSRSHDLRSCVPTGRCVSESARRRSWRGSRPG
jgi:hypothetical protein